MLPFKKRYVGCNLQGSERFPFPRQQVTGQRFTPPVVKTPPPRAKRPELEARSWTHGGSWDPSKTGRPVDDLINNQLNDVGK